jgi:hypothetical protein
VTTHYFYPYKFYLAISPEQAICGFTVHPIFLGGRKAKAALIEHHPSAQFVLFSVLIIDSISAKMIVGC